jgi:hypothetical protein
VQHALAHGVVAEEDHVEAADGVLLDDGLLGGERGGVVGGARVLARAHARGHAQYVVVVQEREVVDGDEADVVPAAVRRQGELDRRERRLLLADGRDDEADPHCQAPAEKAAR